MLISTIEWRCSGPVQHWMYLHCEEEEEDVIRSPLCAYLFTFLLNVTQLHSKAECIVCHFISFEFLLNIFFHVCRDSAPFMNYECCKLSILCSVWVIAFVRSKFKGTQQAWLANNAMRVSKKIILQSKPSFSSPFLWDLSFRYQWKSVYVFIEAS